MFYHGKKPHFSTLNYYLVIQLWLFAHNVRMILFNMDCFEMHQFEAWQFVSSHQQMQISFYNVADNNNAVLVLDDDETKD